MVQQLIQKLKNGAMQHMGSHSHGVKSPMDPIQGCKKEYDIEMFYNMVGQDI